MSLIEERSQQPVNALRIWLGILFFLLAFILFFSTSSGFLQVVEQYLNTQLLNEPTLSTPRAFLIAQVSAMGFSLVLVGLLFVTWGWRDTRKRQHLPWLLAVVGGLLLVVELLEGFAGTAEAMEEVMTPLTCFITAYVTWRLIGTTLGSEAKTDSVSG